MTSATDELLKKLRMLKYDYDSMSASCEDTIDEIADELEQAIAATISGQPARLTAEQVRELIAPHLHARPTFDFGRHGAVWSADFQAIADALNATLGRGTCRWILEHSGTLYDKWRCSKCGYLFVESRVDQGIKDDFDPNYCPNCGARVEGNDDDRNR